MEYRFGTITSFNARCHMFGLRIPYYVWIGCSKDDGSSQHRLARLNAAATESPFLAALDNHSQSFQSANEANAIDIRSKAYESAVINLSASLPLPSTWYQTHHWRLYYDDQLEKHRQFNDEYIYAFTWEDSLVDTRLLKLQEDDVVLAITSAGDNVLSYALERPRRIHVIDVKYVVMPHVNQYMLIWNLAPLKTTFSNSNSLASLLFPTKISGASSAKANTHAFDNSLSRNSARTCPASLSNIGSNTDPLLFRHLLKASTLPAAPDMPCN